MTVTETIWFEMHVKLRNMMGDDVADTLMQHLPPTGWADVARKSDVDHLATLMDARFAAVDIRFDSVDTRFENIESRLSTMTAGMWTMAAVFTTGFVGLFTLIATKL